DQRSLASRRQACEEELRLNRRTAPTLYLGVVEVNGAGELMPSGAPPGSPGTAAADFAVCMRRFDPAQTLDRLIASDPPGAHS
ncbi:hypothetical protein ABTM13_20090, partial [Acinetobacter baumannii]